MVWCVLCMAEDWCAQKQERCWVTCTQLAMIHRHKTEAMSTQAHTHAHSTVQQCCCMHTMWQRDKPHGLRLIIAVPARRTHPHASCANTHSREGGHLGCCYAGTLPPQAWPAHRTTHSPSHNATALLQCSKSNSMCDPWCLSTHHAHSRPLPSPPHPSHVYTHTHTPTHTHTQLTALAAGCTAPRASPAVAAHDRSKEPCPSRMANMRRSRMISLHE
jgi:hypothetical protein